MRHLRLVLSALFATACVVPAAYRPLAMSGPAPVTEYQPFMGEGTGSLSGQAFLTTRGGDVKRGAGRAVTLDPATSYTKEWYNQIGMVTARFSEQPSDSLFRSLRRTATADADGKFVFTNLPAGTYLVRTTVTWETGAAYAGTQGGIVSALVTVKAGQKTDVILNDMSSAYLR